ncbi:helix-turn-helix domain-containing protein [Cellulosilyticum lentocellum]|uniref:Transcriptional regulator, AraC family n=1 Tax=Cellulosilyticum lentocellum (strain ATCC 49066 / DSM 5427 / NCIMB 11756 / RHM5) TaxID=642492 RepID=F2JID2_CELLD|nr:AraC family transcriptional regulator [Cellulosilyticum lentocellum]ADZ84298.1 transcriptional regulator, AraC family [Cellulosilyticum lentocellum DSM 5427]
MLPELHGFQEKITFDSSTGILLYDNRVNEDYPKHWHSAFEVIMPIENTYEVTCHNCVYTLNETDILFVFPGCLHSMKAPNRGERLILQANYNQIYNNQELEAALAPLAPVLLITEATHPQVHPGIYQLLLLIKQESLTNASLCSSIMLAYFIEILVLLGRNCNRSTTTKQLSNSKEKEYAEKFIAICTYINEHCTEALTLDAVASLSGFSKYHFSRLFKLFANISFYKYLNQQRIYHAEKLLLANELTVTEIALQSGFGSLSAFIRMFNIVKGCTPTDFKKLYK